MSKLKLLKRAWFRIVLVLVWPILLLGLLQTVLPFHDSPIGFVARWFARQQTIPGPGRTWWGPLVRTAAVVGDVAYIGLGTELGVLDISNPSAPELIEKRFIGGIAHGFCHKGNALFLAAGPAGVTALDVSNPRHPTLLDQYATLGYGMHCAVRGDTLLYSAEMSGWTLLDVSDPTNIQPLSAEPGGWVSAATIVGDTAFVLDGRSGVDAFDISQEDSPRRISNLPISLPESVYEPDPPPIWLEWRDGIAYISNGSDGLRIADVSNPAFPHLVGHLPLKGYTYTVAVRGNRAWLANINLGLIVVDISNPRRPRVINRCETPGGAYDVIFENDRAYISDGANGFMIVDASDLDHPRQLGYYQNPPFDRSITANGRYLFVGQESGGVAVYDRSVEGLPRFVSAAETKGLANQVVLYENRLMVADVLGGLQIFDFTDPSHLVHIGTAIPEDHPWGIAVDKRFGYVANGHHGFSILDLSKRIPTTIANDYTKLGEDGFGYIIRVASSNGLAVATGLVYGAFFYDVTDPVHPRRAGMLSPRDAVLSSVIDESFLRPMIGVQIKNPYVFFAAYDEGLMVADASDIDHPEVVAIRPTAGHAFGVSYLDGYLAVSEYEGTLTLWDVRDPTNPVEQRSWKVAAQLGGVVLDERRVYVAAGGEGIAVIDRNADQVQFLPLQKPPVGSLTCQSNPLP